MIFKYVIAGNGSKAIAVHSSMNLSEFTAFVRNKSRKIHPDGNDVVFSHGLGVVELVNPVVFMGSDFGDHLPHMIGVD